MNAPHRRFRRAAALVAGLAVAATISVVAPATASAAPSPKKSTTSTVRVVDHPTKGTVGTGGTVRANDWTW